MQKQRWKAECVRGTTHYGRKTHIECEDVIAMLKSTDANDRQRIDERGDNGDDGKGDFDDREDDCLLILHVLERECLRMTVIQLARQILCRANIFLCRHENLA